MMKKEIAKEKNKIIKKKESLGAMINLLDSPPQIDVFSFFSFLCCISRVKIALTNPSCTVEQTQS